MKRHEPTVSRPGPGTAWFAGLAVGLVSLACGGAQPDPGRVRLWECVGNLLAPESNSASEIVLREDFERLPEDWHVITETKDVLAVTDSLARRIQHEGDRSFLTLAGHGAFYGLLPVEGDTPYSFRGELRARGLEPAAEPFHGAIFWVAESSRTGSPAELFAGGRRFDLLHGVASAAGEEGWHGRGLVFRTRPETCTLIVGCVLAVDEPLRSGEVDFDHLRVWRVPESSLWDTEAMQNPGLDPALGTFGFGRRIGAMLGAEQRPSVLVLPGERVEFELEIPRRDPFFTTGLGPWTRAWRPASEPIVPWVKIDGRELLRTPLASRPLSETFWQEVSLDLAAFAGRRVRLELGVDGPLPAVFGAPEVRARAPGATEDWNVLLVSIDTLRADRVGAYGATSGATPALDRLARESLVFEDMRANAPYTLPAHATILSGQFPSVHAVEDRGRRLDPARSPILARILAARGYRTQAFVAGGFLSPDFGFDQGFDGFSIADPLRHAGSRAFVDFRREFPEQALPSERTGEPGLARVRRWLGAHAAEPFFLFLHTYEVHDYDPPPGTLACARSGCSSTLEDFRTLLFPKVVAPFPGTPADRAHLEHLYDAALAHVDRQLGEILDELTRLGLRERTLVVVTSDHGEEFFERGYLQHGKTLYEEQLRIPLILAVPGRAPGQSSTPAAQVDLAPTILAALGIAPDERMQGIDLLHPGSAERPVWAEVNDHFVRKTSLGRGTWKLVHGPPDADVRLPSAREWELYDLQTDPGETRDLAPAEPARLAELRRVFEGFEQHLRTTRERLGPVRTDATLDAATRAQLEHLGYGGSEQGGQ